MPLDPYAPATFGTLDDSPPLLAPLDAPPALQRVIDEALSRADAAGVSAEYVWAAGDPAHTIVDAARDKDVHVVGLSILSGSHLPLVKDVVTRLRDAGLDDVPVVVGGIIPPDDAAELKGAGVAAVYTPKDFELNQVMTDVLRIVERSKAAG